MLQKSASIVLASLRGSTRRELFGGRKHWRDLSVHHDPFKGRTAHTKCGTYLLVSSLARPCPWKGASWRAGERAGHRSSAMPKWCFLSLSDSFLPAECRVVQKSRNSWPDGQGNASIRNHGEASHFDLSRARFGGPLSGSLMGGLFSESCCRPRRRSSHDPSRWAKRDDLLQGDRLSRTQAALREAGEAHDGGLHREPRHCRARAHARQAGSGVCRSVD